MLVPTGAGRYDASRRAWWLSSFSSGTSDRHPLWDPRFLQCTGDVCPFFFPRQKAFPSLSGTTTPPLLAVHHWWHLGGGYQRPSSFSPGSNCPPPRLLSLVCSGWRSRKSNLKEFPLLRCRKPSSPRCTGRHSGPPDSCLTASGDCRPSLPFSAGSARPGSFSLFLFAGLAGGARPVKLCWIGNQIRDFPFLSQLSLFPFSRRPPRDALPFG